MRKYFSVRVKDLGFARRLLEKPFSMFRLLPLLKFVAIAVAIFLVNPASAQSPPVPGQIVNPASAQSLPVPRIMPSNPMTLWDTPIASFDFPGGTLSDFVKQLRPLAIGVDEIKINEGANSIIPPFKQDNTTLGTLLGRLQWLVPKDSSTSFSGGSEDTVDGAKIVIRLTVRPDAGTPPEDQYLENFSFPGGSIADFAKKIRSENLGWETIYFSPDVAARPIPAFSAGRILFRTLPEVVNVVSDGKCRISWKGAFLSIEYINPTATRTVILPLRDVLKSYRIEDVNALVQTALKMKSAGDGKDRKNPDMSFHRETQTLIVVGEPDQVDVVSSVVKALATQGEEIRNSTPSPSPATAK
jgi:hypothetical protein